MVTRRVVIVVIAGLAAVAAWYGLAVALPGRHAAPAAGAAVTPRPIISASPLPTPTPEPTPTIPSGLRVRVPEVGIDLPIVEGDGYNAPLYEAAHYPGTTWPGQGGRSVIYAHARVGMFGPLFGARVGEHIVINSAGGGVLTYIITQYFPHWPVTDLSWLRPGDHEQIVLVTCTTYNYNDPRIIAVGEPVS
jgi:LPXTG-site transpeptidase (sortase) family protein